MVFLGAAVEYTSRNFQDGAQIDDCCVIEPYYRYSAQVGLTSPSQGWSVQLRALNLTDEYHYGFRIDATALGDGQDFRLASPLPPRTYVAIFNWTY